MDANCGGKHMKTCQWTTNPVSKTTTNKMRWTDAKWSVNQCFGQIPSSMMSSHLLLGPWLPSTTRHFRTSKHFCQDKVSVIFLPIDKYENIFKSIIVNQTIFLCRRSRRGVTRNTSKYLNISCKINNFLPKINVYFRLEFFNFCQKYSF